MRIDLTDNNTGQPNAGLYKRQTVAALFPIANKTISQLCRENESLLVFPYSIENTADQIGEQSLITIRNTDNPDMVRIETGNVMGFIGVGDLQMKIKSRFDRGRDDFLLHYMLQKVLSFNLFDLNHNNEVDDVFDLIMFMFPYFLKSALRQGLYREYQNFRHNDANVRGPIDLGRHISHNYPFMGKIAYSTREYSCDNSMTQLIRHTIEFMRTKRYGRAVLNIDAETIENVGLIVEHTKSYDKRQRRSIVSQNLRMKQHPFYTSYGPLQSLCLQILRMEEVKYSDNDHEICGILFDGAWLWEEYVNTVLRKLGFYHPENKLSKGRIYLFADNSGVRYPDFYKKGFVLDAKYKSMGSYDKVSRTDRNDIHQMIAYMNRLRASRGGFVAPLTGKQLTVPTSRLWDSTATISIFGIEVCQKATSYAEFCSKMTKNEEAFVRSLHLDNQTAI